VVNPYITEAFDPTYGARRRGDYSTAELEATARRLGLWGDVWGDEGLYQGITDRQAVFRDLERQDYERIVPLDVRTNLTSPINYGAGTEILRDAQGRPLGQFALGDWTEDGHSFSGSNQYLPWDIARRYPQLNAQLGRQYIEEKYGLKEFLTDPGTLSIFLTAVGANIGAGAAGAEAGAGTAAGESAAVGGLESGFTAAELGLNGASASGGATGGSGMWDWLDDFSDWGSNTGFGETTAQYGNWSDAFNGWTGTDMGGPAGNLMPGAVVDPAVQQAIDLGAMTQTSPGVWELTNPNLLPAVGGSGLGWRDALSLKNLLGGSGPNINIGGGTRGGGILDSILDDPLGAAFNATPFLLALTEANRQGRDIDGVLNSINGEGYRNAVLRPWDMETASNRQALLDDQTLRGTRGSSFGDESLNNFDYIRGIGRGDLASKASLGAAGLSGQLINARNTNRNLLLGAGLNASGRLFSPQRDPFGLSSLLGLA
jgi:hypothetical protein